MRFNRKDRSGGAGTVIIALVILVVLIFLGTTWGMPFIGQQDVAAGDTLIYSTSVTDEGTTSSYTETVTFNNVSSTDCDVTIEYSDGYPTESGTVSLSHEGNMLYLGMNGYFVDSSILPDEKSYTVVMVGFTPILVESYVIENPGNTTDFWVKAGTLLIVKMTFTEGNYSFTSTLTDSSMSWVKVI